MRFIQLHRSVLMLVKMYHVQLIEDEVLLFYSYKAFVVVYVYCDAHVVNIIRDYYTLNNI